MVPSANTTWTQHSPECVPIVDKHSYVLYYNKIMRGERKKCQTFQKCWSFLERALKGLYSSHWQQHGFAMQTVHILRLTPVNRASRLTQVRLSLESSMLPQSQMTARRDWGSTFLWPDGGPKRSSLKDRFVSGFVGSV